MKLEVGMYVRTKYGIAKYTGMFNSLIYELDKSLIQPDDEDDYLHEDNLIYSEHDILKASHNIIDLIEAGDILEINNEKYEVIYDESYEKLGILIPSRKELSIRHSALEYVFKKYNVSIVTKEQFENMAYKVVQ